MAIADGAGKGPMSSRMFGRLLAGCLVVAALLCIPSIDVGLTGDDQNNISTLEDRTRWMATKLDLWRYSTGVPAEVQPYIESGGMPWWTDPTTKYYFYRPVTSAIHVLEYEAFGRNWLGWRLVGDAWWLLLVLAVALVYRRILPKELAPWALIFFTVSGVNSEAVVQLQTLHHVVALVFSLFGFLAHLKWRQDGWRPGIVVAPMLFATGMFSSPTAVLIAAFVAAYELLYVRDGVIAAVRRLVPVGLVVLAYTVVWKVLGCGVRSASGTVDVVASIYYIDPFHDPVAFFDSFKISRAIAFGVLGLVPAHLLMLKGVPHVVLAVASLVVLVAFLWRWHRGTPPGQQPAQEPGAPESPTRLWWLMAAAGVAIFLALSGPPNLRNQMVPMLAFECVAAAMLVAAWRRMRRPGPPVLRALAGVGVLLIGIGHGAAAPLPWILDAHDNEEGLAMVHDALAGAEIPAKVTDVVVIAAPQFITGFGGQLSCYDFDPARRDTRWWIMSPEEIDHVVTRTGERTLEIEFRRGPEDHGAVYALKEGQVVKQRAMTVRVLAMEAGAPTKIAVELDRPLEDPTLAVVGWMRDGLHPLPTLPIGGQTLVGPSAP